MNLKMVYLLKLTSAF